MSNLFLIPEDQLLQLTSTRSGRISYAGYNYQCGYAVSRLASMVTARPLFGLTDYPRHLRYDWGEDLDEILADGSVCFTQCKRIDDIGQPAKLANVLLGFAPKWLWTPLDSRDRIRFRLVSSDPRFNTSFNRDVVKADVLVQFQKLMKDEPGSKSDKVIWQASADLVGWEPLFNGIWNSLSFVYVEPSVDSKDPAGVVLWSEASARDLLLKHGLATAATQKAAIEDLRCLINNSLIAFDPTNDDSPSLEIRVPTRIDVADVRLALLNKKESYRSPPFELVNQVMLSKLRAHPPDPNDQFLFKPPEWRYVVHGTDSTIKFLERDQTESLRNEIQERLIDPLLQGTSNLPVLFVIGPPGAGKSTLVRRVSATMIESGDLVVADAGLNLAGGPQDVASYAEGLRELAGAGRPVLLVLDDPLFEESEWLDLLIHLKQPGFRVAAIAATPDFLYQRYRSKLEKLSYHQFRVLPPSANEKKLIAGMYGRDISTFDKDSDDLLVMIAQAESGEHFTKIMERLWQTLNGGRPFDDDLSFEQLRWEVRAFWFVCFLHRCYISCPMAILRAALELSGGTGIGLNVENALTKLKAQSGWSVFRYHQSTSSAFGFEGDRLSTAHQKIASVAWSQRPLRWLDSTINRILAEATLVAPQATRSVVNAALRMVKTGSDSEISFVDELIKHWQEAGTKPQQLATRHLYLFVNAFAVTNEHERIAPMREILQARAIGKDGWLAALQLWYMSADDVKLRSFQPGIDLASLIEVADFSLAFRRAARFFQAVKNSDPKLGDAVINRLFESIEGRTEWEIDSTLLTWLLAHASRQGDIDRLPHIMAWLKRHKDNSEVRTQYLTFLKGLPESFDDDRKQAATDTAAWLKRHDDNSEVRTRYLTFLKGLPESFDDDRKQAATDTAAWLNRHDDNSGVRTRYLTFLKSLPESFDDDRKQAATDTAAWLNRHDDNLEVRTQYLTFLQGLPAAFDEYRSQAVIDISAWLKRHDDDATGTVRAQYLTFVRSLGESFDNERIQLAQATSDWLERHPDSLIVISSYVSFILETRLPQLETLRQSSDKLHQRLLQKEPNKLGNYFVYGEQLLRQARYDEAIAQFDIVLKRHRGHQRARRGRAMALQGLGKMAEAEKEFKHSLWWARVQNAPLAPFQTSLGEFYLETNQWLKAIKSFEDAQKEFPEHYRNHWGIAKAQLGLGDLDNAEKALHRALDDTHLKSETRDQILQLLDDVRDRRSL